MSVSRSVRDSVPVCESESVSVDVRGEGEGSKRRHHSKKHSSRRDVTTSASPSSIPTGVSVRQAEGVSSDPIPRKRGHKRHPSMCSEEAEKVLRKAKSLETKEGRKQKEGEEEGESRRSEGKNLGAVRELLLASSDQSHSDEREAPSASPPTASPPSAGHEESEILSEGERKPATRVEEEEEKVESISPSSTPNLKEREQIHRKERKKETGSVSEVEKREKRSADEWEKPYFSSNERQGAWNREKNQEFTQERKVRELKASASSTSLPVRAFSLPRSPPTSPPRELKFARSESDAEKTHKRSAMKTMTKGVKNVFRRNKSKTSLQSGSDRDSSL